MVKDSATEIKVIVFELNHEEYAISVEQISSIEMMQPITRVPQTENFVKGVIHLRGDIIPIIDLRTRFGLKEIEQTDETRIIIFHLGGMEVGLIVDLANDIVDIPTDIIESPPEVVGAVHVDYIDGVAKLDDRLLILLNLEKVLTKDEIKQLQDIEEQP